MIVLAGGDIVLPDRILSAGSLVVADGHIVAIDPRPSVDPAGATIIDVSDRFVVPGFVDVHVHGVDGRDALDGPGAVSFIASRLPRYGVTAFCPTSVACTPADLAGFVAQVRESRTERAAQSARVLPAHLESNFISPEYRGAQPAACLRSPDAQPHASSDFSGADILDVIASARPDIGIVTLAPEIDGGLELVRDLVAAGHRVSLGHSGADFDTAIAAIEAGARHATHLFNRMSPMTHRAPGLPGAVLAREDVAAELICDGYHVHPAMSGIAIEAKGVQGVMAITDGTAGSGMAAGATAMLGGQQIQIGEHAAFLGDGTLAGSTLTMDRAFRNIATTFQRSIVDAAILCSTTAARELGLTGLGVVADGAIADLVVLDRAFRVTRTFIGGEEVYRAGATA